MAAAQHRSALHTNPPAGGRPMVDYTPEQRRAEHEVTLTTPPREYCRGARLIFRLEDLAWGAERTLSKFKARELVARSPYRAWKREHRDDLVAAEEELNEKSHWAVLRQLLAEDGVHDSTLRYGLVPLLGAFGMFAFTSMLDRFRPAEAYRLNADIEDHAEHEYALLVAEHPEWERRPYAPDAAPEFGAYDSRADALRQIGLDERAHKARSLERLAAS